MRRTTPLGGKNSGCPNKSNCRRPSSPPNRPGRGRTRLYAACTSPRSAICLPTRHPGLEERLNRKKFIRLTRSHLVFDRDWIAGLRHDGGGVWNGLSQMRHEIRIGRTHLADAKKLAGKIARLERLKTVTQRSGGAGFHLSGRPPTTHRGQSGPCAPH